MRQLPSLLLGLTLLSSTSAASTYPLTVQHTSGETTVTRLPVRVVALGPYALDLPLSPGVQPVGYGEAAQLGVTGYGDPLRQIRYLDRRAISVPLNVGDRFKPNLEIVTALKPDLIVGENYASSAYPALNRAAPTLLFHSITTGDWQKNIAVLGRVLNREARASGGVGAHEQLLQRVSDRILPPLRGKRVLVVWNGGGPDRDVFTVLGPQDWTGGFFQSLGFTLTLPASQDQGLSEGYQRLSSEALPALAPDAVFVIASSRNTVAQARQDWRENAVAQTLRASRTQQVHFLDSCSAASVARLPSS